MLVKYQKKLIEYARQLRKRPTVAERILWRRLMRGQIYDVGFRRQRPIDGYIVDFYAPDEELVIEIDGSSHGDQVEYDQRRIAALRAFGFKVLVFSDTEVRNELDTVIERIVDVLELK